MTSAVNEHQQRWREFSTAVQVVRDGGRPVGAGELGTP